MYGSNSATWQSRQQRPTATSHGSLPTATTHNAPETRYKAVWRALTRMRVSRPHRLRSSLLGGIYRATDVSGRWKVPGRVRGMVSTIWEQLPRLSVLVHEGDEQVALAQHDQRLRLDAQYRRDCERHDALLTRFELVGLDASLGDRGS